MKTKMPRYGYRKSGVQCWNKTNIPLYTLYVWTQYPTVYKVLKTGQTFREVVELKKLYERHDLNAAKNGAEINTRKMLVL